MTTQTPISVQSQDELVLDLKRSGADHSTLRISEGLISKGYVKLSKENAALQERIAKTIHQFSMYDSETPQEEWGVGLNKDGCKFCLSRALIVIHDMLGLPDPDADELEVN